MKIVSDALSEILLSYHGNYIYPPIPVPMIMVNIPSIEMTENISSVNMESPGRAQQNLCAVPSRMLSEAERRTVSQKDWLKDSSQNNLSGPKSGENCRFREANGTWQLKVTCDYEFCLTQKEKRDIAEIIRETECILLTNSYYTGTDLLIWVYSESVWFLQLSLESFRILQFRAK